VLVAAKQENNQNPNKKQCGIITLLYSAQLTNILSQSTTENLGQRSAQTVSSVFSYKQSTGTHLDHHNHSSFNTERPPQPFFIQYWKTTTTILHSILKDHLWIYNYIARQKRVYCYSNHELCYSLHMSKISHKTAKFFLTDMP